MSKHTLERIAALEVERDYINELLVKLQELLVCENRYESFGSQQIENVEEVVHTSAKVVVAKTTKTTEVEKPISLGSLITKIVHDSKKPLTLKQIAENATKSGYKSSAKNFGNNVYQAVNKLVKAKEIKQTRQDGEILYFAA